MVERLALHGDEGVVGALERQPVGHVLVSHDDPAEGMRGGDGSERAPIRQMHQILVGFDQAEQLLLQLLLVGREVHRLGQAAVLAQGFQHLAQGRLGAEPAIVQVPERGKRGVEELHSPIWPVNDDGGGERFQHIGMGGDVPRQLALRVFERGQVEGIADHRAAAAHRLLGQVEKPALALGHQVVALGLRLTRCDRPVSEAAPARVNGVAGDFGSLLDDRRHIAVNHARIGEVAIGEAEVGGTAPHRGGKRVQGLLEFGRPMAKLCCLGHPIGYVAEPDDVDRRAFAQPTLPRGLDHRRAAGMPKQQLESLPFAAQSPDLVVEAFGVGRLQASLHGCERRRRIGLETEQRSQIIGRPFAGAPGPPQRRCRNRLDERHQFGCAAAFGDQRAVGPRSACPHP